MPVPAETTSSESVELALDPEWVRHNRSRRRLAAVPWAILAVALGLILLGSFTSVQGVPNTGLLWLLWVPAFLLFVIFVQDGYNAAAHRFSGHAGNFVTASSAGLSGDVYPLSWYRKIETTNVVRSPIFRRLIAVTTQEPNHGPWSDLEIRASEAFGGARISFRSRRATTRRPAPDRTPAGPPLFAELVSLVPGGALPRLLLIAAAGGAEVNVEWALLTDAARESAGVGALESYRTMQVGTTRYVRIGPPLSPQQIAAWVRPVPGAVR